MKEKELASRKPERSSRSPKWEDQRYHREFESRRQPFADQFNYSPHSRRSSYQSSGPERYNYQEYRTGNNYQRFEPDSRADTRKQPIHESNTNNEEKEYIDEFGRVRTGPPKKFPIASTSRPRSRSRSRSGSSSRSRSRSRHQRGHRGEVSWRHDKFENHSPR